MNKLHILIQTEHKTETVLVVFRTMTSGLVLEAVQTEAGEPVAICSHLVGSFFPEEHALRCAITSLVQRGGVLDTLDRVLLSPAAYQKWQRKAQEQLEAWQRNRTPFPQMDEEMAQLLPKGRLRIYCKIQGHPDLDLVLRAGEWSWSSGLPAVH